MNILNAHDPLHIYLRAFLGTHASRLSQARRDGERGASAIELAIITGVLVLLAIGVLIVIQKVVDTGKTNITRDTIPSGS